MQKRQTNVVQGTDIIQKVDEMTGGVQHIILCSPFLTLEGIKPLLKRFKQRDHIKMDVISRFDEIEWATGVTDPQVFEELFRLNQYDKWEIEITLVEGLHAKVIVLGKKAAIVGSANITKGGFENNLELGILVTDQKEIETILKIVDSYKEAGVPLSPESLAVKQSRVNGDKAGDIKRFLAGIRATFKNRKGPGLTEFTRERDPDLDYSPHVFNFLGLFNGREPIPTDHLTSWLDGRALNSDKPKSSLKRVYFLEVLGMIEEVRPDVWEITPRGKDVVRDGKPRLYFRLKSRWKSFDEIEVLLHREYGNKPFNADILTKHYPPEKKEFLNNHLRWMFSVGVIKKLTERDSGEIMYRLNTAEPSNAPSNQ